eukprot:305556_1
MQHNLHVNQKESTFNESITTAPDLSNECGIFDEETKRILAQCTDKNPLQLHADMYVVKVRMDCKLHQCFDPNTFKKTFNGITKAVGSVAEQSASSYFNVPTETFVTLFDGPYVSCLCCKDIAQYIQRDVELPKETAEHFVDCIHGTLQVLVELMYHPTKYCIWSNVNILLCLCNQDLIRKKFIMTRKKLLRKLFVYCLKQIVQYQNKVAVRAVERILWCSKSAQIKMFCQSKYVIKLMQIIIFEVEEKDILDIWSFKIVHFFEKIWLSKMNRKQSKKVIKMVEKMICASKIRGYPDYITDIAYEMNNQRKCGNIRCAKIYTLHKYNIDRSKYNKNGTASFGKDWNLRKKINKWFICGGCQLISYCSEKCQKYAWVRLNHKYICELIQNCKVFHL